MNEDDLQKTLQEIQRSLGRIEGTQIRTLSELKATREDLGNHKNEDQKNFSLVRLSVAEQKNELIAQFERSAVERDKHLTAQDVTLAEQKKSLAGLNDLKNTARGIGIAVMAMLTFCATVIGGSLVLVIGGWIKVHWYG